MRSAASDQGEKFRTEKKSGRVATTVRLMLWSRGSTEVGSTELFFQSIVFDRALIPVSRRDLIEAEKTKIGEKLICKFLHFSKDRCCNRFVHFSPLFFFFFFWYVSLKPVHKQFVLE